MQHKAFRYNLLRYGALLGLLFGSGCSLLPQTVQQPTLHNPFPQLTKVAVAPFFNHSLEPSLNGMKVAAAYSDELQRVPGFEVISVTVVDRAIRENGIALASPADARRLAQVLGADAVVIGAVSDYTPYYPPRMAIQVEWYTANPAFHPIPPGYGLPWGTSGEKDIPGPLIFEAEMALARAQLRTQTPAYEKLAADASAAGRGNALAPGEKPPAAPSPDIAKPTAGARQLAHQAPVEERRGGRAVAPGAPGLPPDWPNARGFVPPPPAARPAVCQPSEAPVLRHTRTYNGNDAEFTEALENYHYFRNDSRIGGWQAYLQRSDDFVRFCCHMHIWEMLSARGGAGESRVVWRWPVVR